MKYLFYTLRYLKITLLKMHALNILLELVILQKYRICNQRLAPQRVEYQAMRIYQAVRVMHILVISVKAQLKVFWLVF